MSLFVAFELKKSCSIQTAVPVHLKNIQAEAVAMKTHKDTTTFCHGMV
jgi:hypothetical protein